MKVLARTVNFFSKIGNELYLEALPTGLSLKIINPTSTAYVVANIQMNYFISFQQGANDRFEENNCKVSIKPVLKIFKSLAKINTCKIWLEVARMKIIFQFQCKSNILKTHIISLLEHDSLKSLRLPKEFPNKIVGDNKIFGNILVHFHSSIEEITIDAKADETIVSNHIENKSANRTCMRSTLSLASSAFRVYELDAPSNVTFCYKEFKAMAHYAEHNRILVEMNFAQAGDPILIRMKKDDVIHIHFILGTMRPRLAQQNRSIQRANRKLTDMSRRVVPPARHTDSERIDTCHTSYSEMSDRTQTSVSQQRNSQLRENESEPEINVPSAMEEELQPRMRRSELPSKTKSKETFLEGFKIPSRNSTPLIEHRKNTTVPNAPVQQKSTDSFDIILAGDTDDPNSESQDQLTIPSKKRRTSVQQSSFSSQEKQAHLEHRQSEDLFMGLSAVPDVAKPSTVPETVSEPHYSDRKRKQEKIRHIFRKCFEPSLDPRHAVRNYEIYAGNSDSE